MTARERNPERSRERILDAALKEFAAHGYAGARVGAIAGRGAPGSSAADCHYQRARGDCHTSQSVMGRTDLSGTLQA